jgi:hypothetical protein
MALLSPLRTHEIGSSKLHGFCRLHPEERLSDELIPGLGVVSVGGGDDLVLSVRAHLEATVDLIVGVVL